MLVAVVAAMKSRSMYSVLLFESRGSLGKVDILSLILHVQKSAVV